ncbi:MAG TPA: HD domain-containing phosphohydrolase [Thermodesulfovibrionales bacterium]|nr:HD domain-containing phosphohydrolase [Thermodesulfovibrionales bacterium]
MARRIFALFVLCALIPSGVLAYLSLNKVAQNLYSQATDELREASKASGMTIVERLFFLETDLIMMSTGLHKGKEDLPVYSDQGLRERLRDRFKGLVLITNNAVVKPILGNVQILPQLKKDDEDFVLSGKTLLLTIPTAEASTAIYLVRALEPPHLSRSLLVGEINSEYLWGGEGILSPMTELVVLDNSRNLLFSSLPAGYNPLHELQKAMQENPSTGRFTWTYGNDSYLASYWTMFMLPHFHASWIWVQNRSKTDILAPIGSFKRALLFMVLLTFFVVVLLSLIQIRRSLIPIELLKEATKRIAAKDFKSRVTIETNDEFEELGMSFNEMATGLENYLKIMTTLNRIGVSLSTEKNNNRLLELILTGAKHITNADGCAFYALAGNSNLSLSLLDIDSIHIVQDRADRAVISLYDEEGKPNLRDGIAFSALTNATVNIRDMYHSDDFSFSCNRDLDKRIGYHSRSLLNVPVKTHENDIIGVLQLINAQDRFSQEVIAFSEEDDRLLETLASQAAVALSKNVLIEDLKKLFESLVELIATAIDRKSPHTGDHCRRVPELTMMLAEAVANKKEGIFKDFTMSEEEAYELKVAALLHDCGKVTTPVHIADKATRLETISDRIHLVDTRFEVLIRDAQLAFLQKKMDGRSKEPERESTLPEEVTGQIAEKEELARYLEQIERDREFVRTCNRGETIMDEALKERIRDIALGYTWINADRTKERVISEDELYALTSSTGTLTPVEREVINQHVETTIKMLEALPYPKSLRNVPLFAQAHHERMDGKGYPKGLTKEEIPLQGRILAIADIFEALTARNRPYRKEMTLMEALRILGLMKLEGQIDPDLFDVFIQEKVYLQYAKEYLPPSQIDHVDLSQIPGYKST